MQPHGHSKTHCYKKGFCCPCQEPGRKSDIRYQTSSLIQYLLGFMAFRLLLTSPKNIQLYITITLSGLHQLCYQVKKLRRNRTTQCANTMSESQNVKWDSFAILFDITGYLSVCKHVLKFA